MNNRRKLLIERIIDGECVLSGGEPYFRLFDEMLAKERFCFSVDSLASTISLAADINTMAKIADAPYPSAWIETEHHNTALMTYYGTFESVCGMIDVPVAEAIGGPIPEQCLERVVASLFICNVTDAPTTVFQIFPAIVVNSLVENPATGGHPRWLLQLADETRGTLTQLEITDAQDRGNMVLAAWATLNIKGAAEKITSTVGAELNAARVRRGKSVLQNYTYVRSLVEKNTMGGNGGSKSAHMVRGHLKQRKTGTFYWRPHVAGKGGVARREAYIVDKVVK